MLQTIHKLYTEPYIEPYTASAQNPTQRAFAKLYTKRNTDHTFCFWTRISRMEFWTRMERMERMVRNVCDESNESNKRYKRNERKIGNGNRRWRDSSPPRSWKSNNFERFFSDSTLTFLTYRNTFRLPILPIRRVVFLCLPLIFLCLPLIFLCLPLIFPGCASKIPDFKGKVTKKGGSRGSSHISIQI